MIDYLYGLMAKVGITRGQDKVLHAGAGFIIGVVFMVILPNTMYPVIAVIIAGVGKELYDYYDYGEFDFFDMFATLLGGVVGIMVAGNILYYLG